MKALQIWFDGYADARDFAEKARAAVGSSELLIRPIGHSVKIELAMLPPAQRAGALAYVSGWIGAEGKDVGAKMVADTIRRAKLSGVAELARFHALDVVRQALRHPEALALADANGVPRATHIITAHIVPTGETRGTMNFADVVAFPQRLDAEESDAYQKAFEGAIADELKRLDVLATSPR